MADFIPQERVAAHREALREIRIAQDNLAVHYNQDLQNQAPRSSTRWLKALDQLGYIADVVSLAAVAHDAKAAMDAGDRAAAQDILTRWALENAGAILAGRLASLAVAPLLVAGPLGWLAAGGVVLSASMLGGAYSDDVAEFLAGHLAELWDRGLGALRDQFQAAERPYSCPLVLDLDRNGITTLPEDFRGIYFDHDRNGFAERTGWVSPGDGLLVRDLNGNGLIDDGSELFGNHTDLEPGRRAANGFAALRSLDVNGDQYVDRFDAAWLTLGIWKDANSNGSVDAGELLSMDKAGVRRLGVNYVATSFADPQGNQHLQIGEYVAADGTLQAMNDVWFRVDPARTQWLHSVPLDDTLGALPNLKGMGRVMDLHQAMTLDSSGELRLILERWIQGTAAQREALIDPLIFLWTGVASFADGPDHRSLEGRLAVLERLLDRTYRQGWLDPRPVGVPATMLHQAYEDFRYQLEHQLILQTDARPLLRSFLASDGTLLPETPLQGLEQAVEFLDAYVIHTMDIKQLFRLSSALRSLGQDGELILTRIQDYASTQGSFNALYLRLFSEHQLHQGSADSNHLQGSGGQDLLDGGAGHDWLAGGAGRDWLIAGSGNDSLNGGSGDDVYVIGKGGDQKQIVDVDLATGNRDMVLFTDVKPSDVHLVERHGSQLYVSYGSGDRLLVDHYFSSEHHRIEEFHFADGTVWRDVELRNRAVVGGATAGNDWLEGFGDMVNRIDALDGDDHLFGNVFADVLKGGNGHDWLSGGDGDDHLDGGAGHDWLTGGAGRDRLIAGSGNDSLNGGSGDDVYVIGKGGDQKQIVDVDLAIGNRDVVLFTDVKSSDVHLVERHSSKLYLSYGSGDRLLVEHYFSSEHHRIEEFHFADGTVWRDVELRNRAVVGGATAGNDWLEGFGDMVNRIDALDGDDHLFGNVFADVLKGGNGHDWLSGGDGDDHLDGGAGHDWLAGGAGRDRLIAGSGNDSLNGGFGDDVYVIGKGADQKRIVDVDSTAGNRDVVLFADLRSQDLASVVRHGDHLLLKHSGAGQLTIENYFLSDVFRIEAFQFSNNVVWNDRQLRDRVVVGGATAGHDSLGGYNDMSNRINGLDGNDLLSGGLLNDALTGGNGNDALHGGDGDDILDGGAGHDVMDGGRGRDRLVSGTGSDTLNGGQGDDTYVIARSGAIKTVTDWDPNPINKDLVTFTNLRSTDISAVRRQGVHLEMTFTTKDQLVVSNHFLSRDHGIETFKFSNGVTLSAADVLALIPPA